MPDPRKTEPGKRGGSLLTMAGGSDLGGAARKSEIPRSTPAEDGRDEAIRRHRLARSRREARPNPLLHALVAKPGTGDGGGESIDEDVYARLEAEFDSAPGVRPARLSGSTGATYTDRNPPPDWREPRPLIDPVKVIRGIGRSKRLIAATTIAGALTGVMIALATPKKYEAVGEVLIDPRDIRLVDRELIQPDFSPNTAIAIVENQVRIMTSSRILSTVVDRLNLDADPEFNGSGTGFGLPNIIGELRSLLARSDGVSGSDRSHAIATQTLAERLEVVRSGKTFIVTVAVKTESAEKSALVANAVIDVFMENSGDFMSSAASRAASDLGAKLEELRIGVEEAERKVEEFKGEKDLIDARGHLIGDDEIIKLNDQLATARARTIELSAKAASARDFDVESALGGALPEGINSSLIAELRTQYAELMRQASEAAVKFGDKHPQSRSIQAQIDGARRQLQAELRRIGASLQVEARRAVELEQKLAARLAGLKARQVNISEDMVTLRELERDSASKRAVYESFLLRARETGEQTDLNSANISLISSASAPLDPVGPSRAMISIAGTMAGFLLGVGFAGLRGAAEGMFGGTPAGPPESPRPGKRPVRERRARSPAMRTEDEFRDDRRHGTDSAMASAANDEKATVAAGQAAQSPAPQAPPAFPYPQLPAWPHPAASAWPPAHPGLVPYGNPYAMAPMPVYAPPFPANAWSPAWYGPPPAVAYPPVHSPVVPQQPPPTETGGGDRERPQSPKRKRVEDIRDDLREVRNAIYDFADRHARRRA